MKQLAHGDQPDYSQKEFLQVKFPDLVFLESDWEFLHMRIWINSIVPGIVSSHVCPHTVFAYCEEFGLNKIRTLELIKEMNLEAKSVKRT